MAKRILLFLVTNILIIVTISVVLRLLGVQPYLNRYGLDYGQLAVFCLVWGFGGAFISLAISKLMAKWALGVQVIDLSQAGSEERWLVNTVHNLAQRAGISSMPEVGIYPSPEVNAFATGPTRNSALVAVSAGILQRMDHDQLEAVLGHEITHVANGDMVTMTLLQGVINAFVMFLARVAAFAISQAMRSRDERESSSPVYVNYLLVWVFEIVFSLLGSMVVFAFSRHREYRADFGGASLAGKRRMIGALQGLKAAVEIRDPRASVPALNTFKIAGGRASLFASHPSLDDRIAALEKANLA